MPTLSEQFATIFRDFETDGVPASGEHEPAKSDIRALGTQIEDTILALEMAGVGVIKKTQAALYADLAHGVDTFALVLFDSDAAKNGFYVKVGASGAGSWTGPSALSANLLAQAQAAIDAMIAAELDLETLFNTFRVMGVADRQTGSLAGAATYAILRTNASSVQHIDSIGIEAGTTGGTITVGRVTYNAGTGAATFTSIGTITTTANTDAVYPIAFTLAVDEHLGIRCPSDNMIYYRAVTADADAGWIAGGAASNSFTDATITVTQQLQVTAYEKRIAATATAFGALEARATTLETMTAGLSTSQIIHMGDISPSGGTATSPALGVWGNNQAAPADAEWEYLIVNSASAGTQEFAWCTAAKARITATTITVTLATGLNVLIAGVTPGFPTGIIVPAGSLLITRGTRVTYNADTLGGPVAFGGQTNWDTIGGGQVDGVYLQMSARLKVARPKLILPYQSIFAVGDSLTNTVGRTNYPEVMAARYGFNVVNGGRNGNTSTQIKDGVANAEGLEIMTLSACIGRNDLALLSTIRANAAALVADLPHDRFMFHAIPNGPNEYGGGSAEATYNLIMAVNNALASDFGPHHYFDSRAWLIKYGLQSVGITPTAQDLIDIGHDVVPESLRYAPSDFHYGTAGATALGIAVGRELWTRGLLI